MTCPTLWELALGVQLKTDASDSDVGITLINDFAEHYGLCWSIDIADITPIIRGSNGGFIYCYDEANGLLAVAFVPDLLPGDSWNKVCHAAIAAGMVLIKDSLHESYIALNPKDEKQARLAISVAGITPARDSARWNKDMLATITAARQRKAKQIEHQNIMRELALIRAGVDLSDYDPASDTRWLGENVTL
jgi:hypothetical protein